MESILLVAGIVIVVLVIGLIFAIRKLFTSLLFDAVVETATGWLTDETKVDDHVIIEPDGDVHLRNLVYEQAERAKREGPFDAPGVEPMPQGSYSGQPQSAGQRAYQRWQRRHSRNVVVTPAMQRPDVPVSSYPANLKQSFVEKQPGLDTLIEGEHPIVEPSELEATIPEDGTSIPASGDKFEYGVRYRGGHPNRRMRDKRYERNAAD